jgi:oligosaccharide repeat unit polymerase
MPKTTKKTSNVIIWLLILLSYVPMLTLFAFMDQPRSYMYAVTGFWMLVFLLLELPGISILSLKKSQSKIIYYSLFVFLSIIVLFLISKYLGFSLNLDLTKVYDIRSQYSKLKIPLAGYLFNWLGYIVNPVFFAICITKRKWVFAIPIVILQLLLFSSTGNKTFLFALPFVLIMIFIVAQRKPFFWMTIGLAGIILIGIFSYILFDDLWVSSLFARRTLLVPAQLSFFYYDFFSKNGYTFLSHHRVFRAFSNYPYSLNPPNLIGEIYFNRPQMGANNGIYADAFMNFGFIGLIFWGIFLAIILRLVDSFTKEKDIRIMISVIAMPVMSLTNSALLTCLLTHGLLLALMLLNLLPKERNKII